MESQHVASDCFTCEYFNESNSSCLAFPVKIPKEILYHFVKHRTIRKDQEGVWIYKTALWAIGKVNTERPVRKKELSSLSSCAYCLILMKETLTCLAFPKGIPIEIVRDWVGHEEIRPDQVGLWMQIRNNNSADLKFFHPIFKEDIYYISDCLICKFLKNDFTCKAFPKGIPFEILDNWDKHNNVRWDQKGSAIFQPAKWSVKLKITPNRPLHKVEMNYDSDCKLCKHKIEKKYLLDEYTCKAFPKSIPRDILRNWVKHREVRPDQEGEWVFEEKKE